MYMANYKVAQDVEADDKLLGPFSFRQFIYLAIVAMAVMLGWGLSKLFVPLAIIPLPVVVFFGALALPLRKDQPMETYMAALVSFYMKPRRRLWQPDGVESLVEITAPKVVEVQRTKGLSEMEAERRLSYLADLADTRGWSVRHVSMPSDSSSMQADVFNEATATEDVLGDDAFVSRHFENIIDQADSRRRQAVLERMHSPEPVAKPRPPHTPQPMAQPSPPQTPTTTPTPILASDDPHLNFNPYPTMHQSIIQPTSVDDHATPVVPFVSPAAPADPVASTSDNPVSPDIINLANNRDLSIETIAHEAKRIKKKHDDEVLISLR